MTETLHVIHGDAATWSALSLVARAAQGDFGPEHVVCVLGDHRSEDRAALAGVRGQLIPRTLDPSTPCMAWDREAASWCTARGLDARTPRADVPIDPSRIQPARRKDIRAPMSIPDRAPVVGSFLSGGDDQAAEYVFARAAVLAVAGIPAIWIVDHEPDAAAFYAETLSRMATDARVICRRAAPWDVLPACDAVVLDDDGESDDSHRQDLTEWASAFGLPIVHTADAESERVDVRRSRFDRTRRMLSILQELKPTHASPQAFEDAFVAFLEQMGLDGSFTNAAHS